MYDQGKSNHWIYWIYKIIKLLNLKGVTSVANDKVASERFQFLKEDCKKCHDKVLVKRTRTDKFLKNKIYNLHEKLFWQ